MTERSNTPPPKNLTGSWLPTTPNKDRTGRSGGSYDCPSVSRQGVKYFVIHALCIIAINGTIALTVNYFKGKQVIPLKVAALSSGISAGVHHLFLDGRACYEKRNIRKEVTFMGMEKIFSVAMSLLSTPFFTYGCANYLMKAHIKVLPTIILSTTGAGTLFFAELFKK